MATNGFGRLDGMAERNGMNRNIPHIPKRHNPHGASGMNGKASLKTLSTFRPVNGLKLQGNSTFMGVSTSPEWNGMTPYSIPFRHSGQVGGL